MEQADQAIALYEKQAYVVCAATVGCEAVAPRRTHPPLRSTRACRVALCRDVGAAIGDHESKHGGAEQDSKTGEESASSAAGLVKSIMRGLTLRRTQLSRQTSTDTCVDTPPSTTVPQTMPFTRDLCMSAPRVPLWPTGNAPS